MSRQREQPVYLFCAYAPQDEHFYQELAAQFSALSSQGLCTLRHMGDIAAGSDWEQALLALIDQAELVLVFLSPDYFTSLFHTHAKLQDVFLNKAKQTRLIPLLVRPCLWQDIPLSSLAPLPRDGSPISSHVQRDASWLSIVEELRPLITGFSTTTASFDAVSESSKDNRSLWFVPYQRNPFFTGRDIFLATLRERLQTGCHSEQTQLLALSGLGGIGKTQLVLEYAYRFPQDYSAILWVTAETPETLLADFTRLGELLGLSTYVGQESGELLALVKGWFSQHYNWLLILDNVEAIELVRDALPLEARSNGQILLTTRATIFGGFAEMMQVEEMRGLEGERLLFRRIGLLPAETSLEQINEQTRRDAEQIVAAVDGLPLGIDQAGAYIAETGCSLARYLHLFRQCQARLLARRGTLPPGHPASVATTWTLSFQRLEGTPAADVLRLCAFLAPENIPEAIFLKGASVAGSRLVQFAVDPLALDMALAALRNYSLIKRHAENDTISLHRLVQAVLRDTLKPAQQRIWAQRALLALSKTVPEPDTTFWQTWQSYLPHVFACVSYIDAYQLISAEAAALLNQTGTMLRHYARYAEAEKMYARALNMYEQLRGSEDPAIATTLDHQATLLGIQRKYEQAVPLYERALSLREKLLGPEHPDTASTINGLALLYSNWHRYEESQQLYERALAIREKVLAPEHPERATTLDNLAMLYRQQGKYELAVPLFVQALQIRSNALGRDHPMSASTLNNLAVLYRLQGNYEMARPLFEQALQIRERILGLEHPATATAISNLAYLSRLQGQYEQSLLLYEQALHIREHAFGPEHPNATITCFNIGELYQEMGATEQAEDAMRRALLTHEQALGNEHPRVINILATYAQLLRHSGRDVEAIAFEKRVQAARKH